MSSAFIVIAIAVGLPTLVFLSWRNPLYLLLTHILSRVVLDSMSSMTYISIGSVSLMQIYTIVWMLILFAYLFAKAQFRCIGFRREIMLIAGVAIISALVNFKIAGLLTIASKWVYLALLIGIVHYCFRRNRIEKVLIGVWLCLLYPVIDQFYFMLTRPPAVTRGIVSYLGSYDHESDLGFLLLGFVATSLGLCIVHSHLIKRFIFGAALIYAHIAIYLNNYRTITGAMLIFWFSAFSIYFKKLAFSSRLGLGLVAVVVPIAVVLIVGGELSVEFSDLGEFLSQPGKYLDFSGRGQRNLLMSGRIDIINALMSAYLHAPAYRLLFGLGPGGADFITGVYSHNEYLSALVETGVFGLLALIYLIVRMARRCYRVAAGYRGAAIVFTAAVYTIFFTGLGTMPFRDMRAMMILGICLGGIEYFRVLLAMRKREQLSSD